MKKIGILTFHGAHNYGAMLQAFALSKKLSENKNNDIEIINYYNKKIYSSYKVIRPLRRNLVKCAKQLLEDLIYYSKKKERYNSFEKFINSKCKLSVEYKSEDQIKNSELNYDVLITGSDQVWNSKIVGELSDIYTLNFNVNMKMKKISYAASVGDVTQIDDAQKEYVDKLSSIDYISVREADAKEKLQSLLSKKVEEVLDPTLLLTKDDWNKELNGLTKEKEKYILAYVVEPDDEYIKIVNDLSEKTGLRVLHFGLKNPGYKNVYKSAYVEGPLEFVNYIKNAEYVVATSFHATVFSIIFNRNFYIIPHRKTGARVINLLDKLGIENRVFYNYEQFKNIDYNIETNWNDVLEKLNKERENSIKWLNNAILDEEDKNV